MAVTAIADLNTLPNFYNKKWLEKIGPGPAIMEYTTQVPLDKNSGTTIYFPKMSNRSTMVSAALLTEGVAMTPQKTVDTQISAVVLGYGDTVSISDLSNMTALNGTVQQTVETLADQAGRVIDRKILEVAYGTSSNPTSLGFSAWTWNTAGDAALGTSTSSYATYVGVTEHRMKAETLRAATAKLRALDVPPFDDGMFALICHSTTASRLRADTEWQNAFIYTDATAVRKGISSAYEGVKVITDNNVWTSANGSASAVLYCSVLLGRGALGTTKLDGGVKFYAKRPGPTTTSDPADQFITLAWKAHFTAKVLNVSSGLIVVTADA